MTDAATCFKYGKTKNDFSRTLIMVWQSSLLLLDPVTIISGSKTEIVYLASDIQGQEKIIFVVKPFSGKLAKVTNPYYDSNNTKLFINDQYLLISHLNRVIGVETKSLFDETQEFVFQSKSTVTQDKPLKPKVAHTSINYLAYEAHQQRDDQYQERDGFRIRDRSEKHLAFPNIQNSSVYQEQMRRQTFLKTFKEEDKHEQSHYIDIQQDTLFFDANCPMDERILAIDFDFTVGHHIIVYTTNQVQDDASLSITKYALEIDSSQGGNESTKLKFISDHMIDEHVQGEHITKFEFTRLSSCNDTLVCIMTKSGAWFIMKQNFSQILCSSSTLIGKLGSQDKRSMTSDIKVGLEGIYVLMSSGKTCALPMDETQDNVKIQIARSVELTQGNFLQPILSERFVRIHSDIFRDMKIMNGVLTLAHGYILSLTDIGSQPQIGKEDIQRKWIHCSVMTQADRLLQNEKESKFGRQKGEIREFHFMSINSNSSLTLLLVQNGGTCIKKLTYYPNMGIIRQINPSFSPNNDRKISRVTSHFNSTKYKEIGECNITLYIEAREDLNSTIDIYKTTQSSQIILIATGLDSFYSLVRVNGASTNLIFLVNRKQLSLSIFKIPYNTTVLDQQELLLCLTHQINNFPYKDYLQYYISGNNLHYLEEGNVHRISLDTGKRFVYDFDGFITQIFLTDERSLYGKDKQEQLYFLDTDWLRVTPETPGKIKVFYDQIGLTLCEPIIKKSAPSLIQRFEGDLLSQSVATFMDPYKIIVMKNLNSPSVNCDGSIGFHERYAAFNIERDLFSASDFNASVSALDVKNGYIKSWNIGTGKVQSITPLTVTHHKLLKEFKFHNAWAGCSILKRKLDNSESTQWVKLRIAKCRVDIDCQVNHKQNLGSLIFIGSNNQILLEFDNSNIDVYQIVREGFKLGDDFQQTKFLSKIKLMSPYIKAPIYFSPDFSSYLDYNGKSRWLQLYRIPLSEDKMTLLKKEYVRTQGSNIPDYAKIASDLKTGLPLIEFEGLDNVRYVNKFHVEQTIPIDGELDGFRSKIVERKLNLGNDIGAYTQQFFSRYDDYLTQTRLLQKYGDSEILKTRAEQYHQGRNQIIASKIDSSLLVSIPNSLRVTQSFTYNLWRIIEKLSAGQIDIGVLIAIPNSKILIQQLLDCILPTGDTLLHRMVSVNSETFDKLIKFIEQNGLNLRLLPTINLVTPLHICVRDSQITNASRLLKVLSVKPLDDHSQFIKDLLPDLLKLCPLALADYLDSRLIKVEWTPLFTDGKLKHPQGCDFAVTPLNLFPLNDTLIKKEIFEDGQNFVDVNLPLNLVISDIPELHLFCNETGKAFLKQLSLIEEGGTLFSKKYIQALIEVKWPPIRRALMFEVFLPYLIYLALFNVYALHLVYQNKSDMISVVTFTVQGLLCLFTIVSLRSELQQYKSAPDLYITQLWNYFDVIPKLLVLFSLSLNVVSTLTGLELNTLINGWVPAINAICMFCLWMNILNFFRLFRDTGYLIHLIIQVIKDMRFFLAVLSVTFMSFSGTFYILSRSNEGGSGDFIESSYLKANAFTYQLLLGDFNTENFGSENIGLTWFFFILSTLFLIVVMLNLLISIISATFSRVQSQAKQRMYHEFAQLIVENSHLLTADTIKELDSKGRYLYIGWLEKSFESDTGMELERNIKQMLSVHRTKIVKALEQQVQVQLRSVTDAADQQTKAINNRIDDIKRDLKVIIDHQEVKAIENHKQCML